MSYYLLANLTRSRTHSLTHSLSSSITNSLISAHPIIYHNSLISAHSYKFFPFPKVTIVTGPTGSGKTTLLAQLSLDLAAQGVSTLWGSFEIKAPRLVAAMLAQLRSGRVVLSQSMAAEVGAAAAATAGGGISSTITAEEGMGMGGGSGSLGLASPTSLSTPSLSTVVEIDTSATSVTASTDHTTAHDGGGGTSSSVPSSQSAPPPAVIIPVEDVGDADPAAIIYAQFEAAADAMAVLPLRFLRFFGSTDVDQGESQQ